MKKLSSNFTGFAKKGFPFIRFIVFVLFITFVVKAHLFFLLWPLWTIFLIGFIVNFVWTWKKVVDFYVDYKKKEILLDNLMGTKHRYAFSQLASVGYKFGYIRRVKLTFTDGRSFTFFTKDFWLFELANAEGLTQIIKQEMLLIQMKNLEN